MILTPIPPEALANILDRFMAGLHDPSARATFRRIRATSADRVVGPEAEQHRRAALSLARAFGMGVHPEGVPCRFNWDGTALNGATEAYVILHEIGHFALAPPDRRGLVDFGLGPGPDTLDRETAERAAVLCPLAREEDEAAASLLGIVWEAELEQPALASFLDQNWLEGVDRSAAGHFAAVLGTLWRRRLLTPALPGHPIRRSVAGTSELLEPQPHPFPLWRRVRILQAILGKLEPPADICVRRSRIGGGAVLADMKRRRRGSDQHRSAG